MRVTFDTNTLDRVVRPHLSTKDERRAAFQKINAALADRRIEGVFSETLITIEGVKKADRETVFGGTRLRHNIKPPQVAKNGTTAIPIKLIVEQPARKPLAPKFVARVNAAITLGLRMLRSPPRVGMLYIEYPDGAFFVQDPDSDAMGRRLDRCSEVLHAIEVRGRGFSRLQGLASQFAARANVNNEPWYRSLVRTNDIHEKKAVERAFAEWSDADSIAAHIGYGIDLFCTEDKGNTGGGPSVFDMTNRDWLTQTYGVRFATLLELAAML